jgi:hypothetical protein
MSVRLFHKHARLVLVRSRHGAGDETWWAPHLAPRNWTAILAPALRLLTLEPDPRGESAIRFRIGSMHWTNGRYWSTITLRFDAGSERKRALVAAALLKAARYSLAGRKQQEG